MRKKVAKEKPDLILPPIEEGMQRGWHRCRRCKNVYYRDYIPFGLGNPIITLPCGHGLTELFQNKLKTITKEEALKELKKKYARVLEEV